MIESLSSWTKSIVLAVIIVSILEMLLPNNKHKKYIKMVMGIFILYNIISPIIKNQDSLSFEEIDLNKLSSSENNKSKTSLNNIVVNQESMDKRLEELYIQQIEKDITKKLEKKGFLVKSCKVKAKISQDENNTGISKIKLKIEKDNTKVIQEEKSQEDEFEGKIVAEIQKIKKISTGVSNLNDSSPAENNNDDDKITSQDIQNVKQFLIKEYEVSEQCLEIN